MSESKGWVVRVTVLGGRPRYLTGRMGGTTAAFKRDAKVFPTFSEAARVVLNLNAGSRGYMVAEVVALHRGNPARGLLSRPLAPGFHRLTDAQAGALARAVGKKLPAHGRELRVEVPGLGLRWLTRTPYGRGNWTDAPTRGWVWAIH